MAKLFESIINHVKRLGKRQRFNKTCRFGNEKEKSQCKPDKHDKWIQCDNEDKCAHQYAKGWFHTFCVDITDAEAQNFEYEGKEWICMWCVGSTKK